MESLTNLANETYIVESQACNIMEVTYLDNLPGIGNQVNRQQGSLEDEEVPSGVFRHKVIQGLDLNEASENGEGASLRTHQLTKYLEDEGEGRFKDDSRVSHLSRLVAS